MVVANVEFAAYDGLDNRFGRRLSFLPGGLVFCLGLLVVAEHRADEFEGTHHVAVVGERYGGHLMPGCRVDERIDRDGGLQDRKLAVVVQTGEWSSLEQLFVGL